MYSRYFKRSLDILVSLLLLSFFSPLLVVTILILLLKYKSNPFFTQPRPGKNGKIFKVLKLKTMSEETDIDGSLLPDKMRITVLGKIIRQLSIDELPQLFNIFKGDMSLVGPRPLLVQYMPLYNPTQKRRHDVKPGITGWAQVNGRNTLSWKQKFELDVWYVDNQSFWLDIKILYLTVLKVLKMEGVSSNDSVTMETFSGNE